MSTFIMVDSSFRDRTKDYNYSPAKFQIPIEVTNKWKTLDRTVAPVSPHCGKQNLNMNHTCRLLTLTVPWNVNSSLTATLSNSGNINMVNGSGIINLEAVPYLYVCINSTTMYNDKGLINTMESCRSERISASQCIQIPLNQTPYTFNPNIVDPILPSSSLSEKINLSKIKFVVYMDRIQGLIPHGANPSGLFPKFVQYKCHMTQTFRIDQKDSLEFTVLTPDGKVLPILDNPYGQPINPLRQVSCLFELTPYIRDDYYSNHNVSLDNSPY